MDLLDRLALLGARVERFAAKKPVVFRGEIVTDFYVLKHGAAVAQYKAGRQLKTLTLGPGDFFCESALLGDAASEATVRALMDGTTALAVDIETLRREVEAEPALRELLTGVMVTRRLALQNLGVFPSSRLN